MSTPRGAFELSIAINIWALRTASIFVLWGAVPDYNYYSKKISQNPSPSLIIKAPTLVGELGGFFEAALRSLGLGFRVRGTSFFFGGLWLLALRLSEP